MDRINSKQNCLIVLGMHRSGTSAMARVVNLLGAEIGDNLLPAEPNNPRGFWEHYEILQLHRRLLREIESLWDNILPFPEKWWLEPAVEEIRSEIIEIVQRDFGSSKLWVLKEPRMCRLLKIWHRIFSEIDCKAHFIHVFRHPLEVAASLNKRNGLPLHKSLLFWLEHVLEGERETRNYPRVFVSFQELINDWKATLVKISEEFQIDWPVSYSEAESEINAFLDPSLKHHNCSKESNVSVVDLPEYISTVYDALVAAQNGLGANIADTFSAVSESLYDSFLPFPVSALLDEVQLRMHMFGCARENLERTTKRFQACNAELNSVYQSKSWRITAPLRYVGGLFLKRKAKRAAQNGAAKSE